MFLTLIYFLCILCTQSAPYKYQRQQRIAAHFRHLWEIRLCLFSVSDPTSLSYFGLRLIFWILNKRVVGWKSLVLKLINISKWLNAQTSNLCPIQSYDNTKSRANKSLLILDEVSMNLMVVMVKDAHICWWCACRSDWYWAESFVSFYLVTWIDLYMVYFYKSCRDIS